MNSNGSFDMIERGKRVAEYKLRLTEFLKKMDSHLLCRCKENENIFCENKHVDKACHSKPPEKIRDRMSWDRAIFSTKAHMTTLARWKPANQFLAMLGIFHNKEALSSMTHSPHQQQLCDHC